MIYDCFIFFDETDLLAIRLNELNSIVDKFVIVEGNLTHSGKNKEYNFGKYNKTIEPFKNKIIYLQVDLNKAPDIRSLQGYTATDYIEKNPMAWSREIYQRNYISNGLKDANPDDLIMVSDIDEIPNKNKIKEIKNANLIYGFEQNFYYYYLNCINTNEKWIGTKATQYKNLKTPQELRMSENYNKIINGGWHFSYLGGNKKIKEKLNSFAHQEFNTEEINNLQNIKKNIENNLDILNRPYLFEIIKIDDTYPKYIINNIEKYKNLIKNNKKQTINTKWLISEILKNRVINKNLILNNNIQDVKLKEQEGKLKYQDVKLKEQEGKLKYQDVKLKEQEGKLKYQDVKLKEQEGKLNEYFTILSKIYHSKMWKILNLYKKTLQIPKKIIKNIIPISIRKKIKYLFESKLISKTEIVISGEILKEWKNYKRQNNNFDLFNFGVIAWDFRYQRPQQLANLVAKKGNRVFYIKSEFTPYSNENIIFAPIKVEKKDNNVYEITLSASRNLFIYNDRPSEKDKKIIFASLKTIIDKANIINPIAKIDHPFWKNIIDDFGLPYIYDCMDNHQGFAETGKENQELEQILFKDSQKTIVTSNYLHKLAKKYQAKNISIIKNAGDYNHFNIINKNLEIPEDIKNIKNEIIGYYGAIAEWFDTEILEDIALNNPDKCIVLIGNVTNNKVNLLSKKYKNIILLGEKPYSILPNYLKQFDVCIIPFVINELIKATHPVKIFEFLAAGKPVVVTKMPEIFDLKNVIYFAQKSNFNEQVQKALKNKDKNITKRQDIAKKNTWITRANDLTREINKIIFPKVSIVLLSYNNSKMLNETITSILNRSFYPNLELIIVDNHSNKETISVLNKYINNKYIKIIFNKKNYGFAKGNNIGMKNSSGDYIILINNDILVTPGWISRLIYHLNKPKVGLVGPVTNSIGNEAKINIEYNPNNISDLELKAKTYTSSHWNQTLSLKNIAAFCWIMSKNIYKKIGDLDERFGRGFFEDDDYCLRVRQAGYEILIADDTFIHHYGGASFKQIQSEEYKKLFNENKIKFEKKWNIKWLSHKYRL